MYLFATDVERVLKPLLKPAPARALPSPRARGSRAVRFAHVLAGPGEFEAGKVEVKLSSMLFFYEVSSGVAAFFVV